MALKTKTPDSTGPDLQTIDELRRKHNISRAVFAGTCTAQGWAPGKALSEDAFLAAIAAFTRAPMGRKEARKKC